MVVEKLVVFQPSAAERFDDVDVEIGVGGDQAPEALSAKFSIGYRLSDALTVALLRMEREMSFKNYLATYVVIDGVHQHKADTS